MKVYVLYRESLRFGTSKSIEGVTTSLEKAKSWAARKKVINEYEHTEYHYSEHEVEK